MTTASRPPATALCGARVRATCSRYTTSWGTTISRKLKRTIHAVYAHLQRISRRRPRPSK